MSKRNRSRKRRRYHLAQVRHFWFHERPAIHRRLCDLVMALTEPSPIVRSYSPEYVSTVERLIQAHQEWSGTRNANAAFIKAFHDAARQAFFSFPSPPS